jgi:hypothetical protein
VAVPVIVSVLVLGFCPVGALIVSTANCPAVICGDGGEEVTPDGNPETVSVASCVKPLVLASDTLIVVVCPGISGTVAGVAVSVKFDAAVIVSVCEDCTGGPLAVTVTGPVAAPVGITKVMLVAEKMEIGAESAPPGFSVTVGVTLLAVKFVPVTVTAVPTGAEVTLRFVMVGGGITVKATPLLAIPPTVTTTFPVVALLGTGTTMLVVLQLVGVPETPLKVTVLAPCVDPKFVPVTVTEVPITPEVGLKLVMLGVAATVNVRPLLAKPETVTTTFPVVAPLGTGTTMLVVPQLVGVPAVPLNLTVLVPCVDPKFVPVTVTEVPT